MSYQKENDRYLKATKNNKRMGLNNTECLNPIAFCYLHKVYLSEDDIVRKQCNSKLSQGYLNCQGCDYLSDKFGLEHKITKDNLYKILKKQLLYASSQKNQPNANYDYWRGKINAFKEIINMIDRIEIK